MFTFTSHKLSLLWDIFMMILDYFFLKDDFEMYLNCTISYTDITSGEFKIVPIIMSLEKRHYSCKQWPNFKPHKFITAQSTLSLHLFPRLLRVVNIFYFKPTTLNM